MTTPTRYQNRLHQKAWAAHGAALDLAAHLAVVHPDHAAKCVEFATWIEQRLGIENDPAPDTTDEPPAGPRP